VQEFQLLADARVRMPPVLQRCLGSRNKSKNRDKQLTHIVRVGGSVFFNYGVIEILV